MSRRKRVVLVVAMVAIVAGGFLLLGFSGRQPDEGHHGTFAAVLPVYTSLIAVFVATRRRRGACANEKKNG